MGFFSDLKDDLSQAVNELTPEEKLQAAQDGGKTAESLEAEPGGIPTPDDLSDKMEALATESGAEEMALEEPVSELAPAEDEMLAALASEADDSLDSLRNDAGEDDILAELGLEEASSDDLIPDDVVLQLPEEQQTEDTAAGMDAMETVMPAALDEAIKEEEMAESQQEKEREEEDMEMEMELEVQQQEVSDETAVVTEGMSITGDITSGGSLELIGTVIGNIDILGKLNITGAIQGNSKAAEIYAEGARINGEINSGGSVKIGQSSVVIGNINASSAVIAGAVKGDIDVHGPVVLDTSAIVMGNIKSKSVQINNGAVIEGMCSQCYADVNPTSFFEEIKKNKEKGKNK